MGAANLPLLFHLAGDSAGGSGSYEQGLRLSDWHGWES